MLKSKKILKIAAADQWGRLTPQQQSTSMGDSFLGNAFEPLVDLSTSGGITTGLAESWTVNEDSTEFLFNLRDDAKFSDGTPVLAQDLVRSWLGSVTTSDIDSEKPNTLDVLYKIKGFTPTAAKEGKVSGIEVIDEHQLKVVFTHPFRTALFEFSGTRYAAWKKAEDGRVIGSGPYQILEHDVGRSIRYVPNPFYRKNPRYHEVHVQGFDNPWIEGRQGDFEVIMGRSPGGPIPDGFSRLAGSITGHLNLFVSALDGQIFSDSKNRRALQALFYAKCFPLLDASMGLLDGTDPQIYPPLWPGRLSDDEQNKLITAGQDDVPALIKQSEKKPIRFKVSSAPRLRLLQCLKDNGLHLTSDSFEILGSKEFFEYYYGQHSYDLFIGGASVLGNDPDGIYHLLGQNGALHTRQIDRENVSALMESGRKLKRTADLDSHYKNVSRALFTEVPLIHLGFYRSDIFYKSNQVSHVDGANNSDRFSFDEFK